MATNSNPALEILEQLKQLQSGAPLPMAGGQSIGELMGPLADAARAGGGFQEFLSDPLGIGKHQRGVRQAAGLDQMNLMAAVTNLQQGQAADSGMDSYMNSPAGMAAFEAGGDQMGPFQPGQQLAAAQQLGAADVRAGQLSEEGLGGGSINERMQMEQRTNPVGFARSEAARQQEALAAQPTPTQQLAAATDADALERIRQGRPVPKYATETTAINPYNGREMVIPHAGTPEFNKKQEGLDAGVRKIRQIQDLMSMIEDMGPTGTDFVGQNAKRFDSSRGLFLTELGLLQELGVLSESDIELVAAGIEDVTSWGSNIEGLALGIPASIASLAGGDIMKGTTLAGYDETMKFIERKIVGYYKQNPYLDINQADLSQRMRLELEPPER